MELQAKKDGLGNVIISEDSFEMLLACLDNQKFVHELPINGDSISVGQEKYKSTQKEIQKAIDEYNVKCREILHQKLIFETKSDCYFLTKRYEKQAEAIDWTWDEVLVIRELFKDTIIHEDEIEEDKSQPKGGISDDSISKSENFNTTRPWLIERNVFSSEGHLTISENGKINRPWKEDEIKKITLIFTKTQEINYE